MEDALGYQYDVFLSYKRSNNWPRYVEKHFFPMFRHWLDAELGYHAKIFFDAQDIEIGESWPHKLAYGVAHSKTMVCLWSREYFRSEWCKEELTQMLARRKSLAGPAGPPPLILAVILHDCQNLDPILADIQRLSLKDYSNPWIAESSLTAERLSEEIERLATAVAHSVALAPDHDESWPELITKEFLRLFHMDPGQDLPPSLG